MRTSRFYVPLPLSCGDEITLPSNKSHYLGNVLRAELGASLILFNGDGGEYIATITRIEKKSITAAVLDFNANNNQSSLQLELAIGISRGDKMDIVIQKSTELGVTAITPLFTERTTVKLNRERLERRLNHWYEIAVSACEQCQRNILPKLNYPTTLQDWISKSNAEQRFVLHHRDQNNLDQVRQIPSSISLLVGPEGGLSIEEIALAENHRFLPLTLGPRVLRTETAPLVALTILQHQWGDLR